MNATNPNLEIRLSVVDDDSKRLAIIYSTLGTMLALASLAFAALTWARSRRHQCEVNSKTDHAVESNELGPEAREAYEPDESSVGLSSRSPKMCRHLLTLRSVDQVAVGILRHARHVRQLYERSRPVVVRKE
jgi:hypothetical protein